MVHCQTERGGYVLIIRRLCTAVYASNFIKPGHGFLLIVIRASGLGIAKMSNYYYYYYYYYYY